ncbi:lipid-binding SYLF domain-containing protein [Desulfatirhabdium butyrativorans]|uniref:lipid-binding SYLF domain-containing protein n=1 Tax=Desulfatirhabdium butyrativorans TaxID=340467 RepID=UPI0003FE6A3C|nr:lipid-binding SYLF domain-containing protein [Desulfatirhabdium butyrativorans]
MKTITRIVILSIFLISAVPGAWAGISENKKVEEAIEVLREIHAIPERDIPPALLKYSYGIAVIPGLLKVGFILGGQYGTGVLCIRGQGGQWSNPVFVRLIGGSLGWQIGAQSTDIVLVFKSRRSVDAISAGTFTLGADASVAAGPVGRQASAGTDIRLSAEIYSYSRSRGLFAGVSIEGASLEMDYAAIADFYNNPQIGARDVFENATLPTPRVASELRSLLNEMAR